MSGLDTGTVDPSNFVTAGTDLLSAGNYNCASRKFQPSSDVQVRID
jgi:hypothetical protein